MGDTRFSYYLHRERSDEQLLDDALKRAFPPAREGQARFKDLLDQLREQDDRAADDD